MAETFPFDVFIGFDWAKEHHQVVIVDDRGRILDQFQFEHTAEGWNQLESRVATYPRAAVAIENRVGPAVEQLIARGFTIYPVDSVSAKRYRERKVPGGVKSDLLDAWALADALRVDGHGWRKLLVDQAITQELRLLCHDEVHLIGQQTELVNKLQECLAQYHPAVLEAFKQWTLPAAWKFLLKFPTPAILARKGPKAWKGILKELGLSNPSTLDKRMACFAHPALEAPDAVITAKEFLAKTLVGQLLVIRESLDGYRERINAVFASHPDHLLFQSLPGLGEKLAPRILAELGDHRERFDNPNALQAYAGTAPISFQSGQVHRVRIRQHCNKHLRAAVHHWAAQTIKRGCPWAKAYYEQKRAEGKSYATALRCLGQRWIKIVWKMWQTRTPYDESLHLKNQLAHGSWVLKLIPETKTTPAGNPNTVGA